MHEIAEAAPGDIYTSRLSVRESEVLSMVATGLTNTQIAKQLDVTVHGVKFHLTSIYRKLGVSNRTEAAVLFTQRANGVPGGAE
jgi:DNA-binding CsgD family transcriptional regulator